MLPLCCQLAAASAALLHMESLTFLASQAEALSSLRARLEAEAAEQAAALRVRIDHDTGVTAQQTRPACNWRVLVAAAPAGAASWPGIVECVCRPPSWQRVPPRVARAASPVSACNLLACTLSVTSADGGTVRLAFELLGRVTGGVLGQTDSPVLCGTGFERPMAASTPPVAVPA